MKLIYLKSNFYCQHDMNLFYIPYGEKLCKSDGLFLAQNKVIFVSLIKSENVTLLITF